MPHYKDINNQLHFLDSTEFEHLLPAGCVAITDEERHTIEAANNPIPSPPTYQQLRATAYPPIADYLDGVVKGDITQQQAYIDACLAVKLKYPKS